MSQTITLYVDGACKGNPGPGGWGAYIITENKEHKLCGGEAETTNNRMELTAAIEGISFCPVDAALILWTDSNYVKRGITEWIEGWKKKNWKDVKNPDLWKKLDQVCQGRQIEWNWIKGHAGHPGNEMADQLANQGVEQLNTVQTAAPITNAANATHADKKKVEPDWLLNDPFGLDFTEDEEMDDELVAETETDPSVTQVLEEIVNVPTTTVNAHPQIDDKTEMNDALATELAAIAVNTVQSAKIIANTHPQIVITPATLDIQGPRQLILDTETTGFYFQDSDRIVEVGAVEMINRKLTGSSIHIYINPGKPVGDSEAIHGITDEFLKDKPKYQDIAQVLFDYLEGAEIIAHNATFDMNFLDMEFTRSGFKALSKVCTVTDTLAMAKSKHPGQKNSLDALVRRYEIPQRDRTFHGALLDAEILADVYLAMTGGQVSFDIDALSETTDHFQGENTHQMLDIALPVIAPSAEELEAHENWVKQFQEKNGEPCLFAK